MINSNFFIIVWFWLILFLLLVYLFAEEGEAAFPLYVLLPVAAINEVDVAAVRRGQIAVVLSVVHLVLRCRHWVRRGLWPASYT